jgi:hypothetical protein
MDIKALAVKTPDEFKQAMESRGWDPEMLAVRWCMTKRRIQQIMADSERPRYYDDAVENLPIVIRK